MNEYFQKPSHLSPVDQTLKHHVCHEKLMYMLALGSQDLFSLLWVGTDWVVVMN